MAPCMEDQCVGCGACAAACQKSALSMRYNSEGFLQPFLQEDLCTHCGQCERVCPVQTRMEWNKIKPTAIVLKMKDERIVQNSASGGAFTAFAQMILAEGGAVYGAAWRADHTAEHERVDSEDGLSVLRGSKYVQSDATAVYLKVKADLEQGKMVFFTGVPCQVAALYGYLGKDYPELYTADIVCHGGGSPRMLCDHLEALEKKYGTKLRTLSHTDKTKSPWTILIQKTCCYVFEDGQTRYSDSSDDTYLSLFLNGFTYRKVCYHCPFASMPRVSDITMGDFFGFGICKHHDFNTSGGVSQVLLNTTKGVRLFESVRKSGSVSSMSVSLWECLIWNHNLWKPTQERSERDELYRLYVREGFEAVEKEYYYAEKNVNNRKIRKIIKKILGQKGTLLGMYFTYRLQYGRRVKGLLTELNKLSVNTVKNIL